MKVCLNTCWFSFDCPGGGEIQFLRTHEGLVNLGVEAHLYDQWNPHLSSFDLVHFFTVQQGMASFCEYVKSKNLPLVLSPIFWPSSTATRGQMWEIEKMLRLADIILPNSATEAKLLAETFDLSPEKFRVVRNGIEPEVLVGGDAEFFREHFSLQEPFFLCVGNLEPRKNQLRVLEVLREMKSNYSLVCIGHVRDQAYLRRCEEFGSDFRYLGAMPYGSDMLKSAFRAASGFILLSLFETPGLAALEAIALGCPTAITERGCTHEYFGDNAFYANPDDRESMTVSLRELTNLADQKVRVQVDMTNYFWKHTAEQTLSAYQSFFREG